MLTPEQVQQYRQQYGLSGTSAKTASAPAPKTVPFTGPIPKGATRPDIKWANPQIPIAPQDSQARGNSSFQTPEPTRQPTKLPDWYTKLKSGNDKTNGSHQGVQDFIKNGSVNGAPAPKQGVLANLPGSIGTGVKEAGNQYKDAYNKSVDAMSDAFTGKQSAESAGIQTVGNFVKPTVDAANGVVNETLGRVISPVFEQLNKVSDFLSGAKQGTSEQSQQQVFDAYHAWAEKHPEASKDLEAASNIGQFGLIAGGGEDMIKGAKDVGGKVIDSAKRVGSNVSEKVGSTVKDFKSSSSAKADIKATQDALEVIKPKLTPTEEAAAKASGRGTTTGKIFKKVEIKPTSTEVETAGYAKEAGVKSGNSYDKNIELMKKAQTDSAAKVRKGLEDSDAIWNKNELKSGLDKVEKPLTIKSDTTLNKLADNFKKAVIKIAEKANKKAVGILDLRQELDILISKEFPSNIYSKDTPIGQYVRNVRRALNDFAESKLPEGKLSDGSTLKGELRRQSVLYDAIDNVAEKAPKTGESGRPILGKALNFAKKHPYITGAAAVGVEKTAKSLGIPLP